MEKSIIRYMISPISSPCFPRRVFKSYVRDGRHMRNKRLPIFMLARLWGSRLLFSPGFYSAGFTLLSVCPCSGVPQLIPNRPAPFSAPPSITPGLLWEDRLRTLPPATVPLHALRAFTLCFRRGSHTSFKHKTGPGPVSRKPSQAPP